MYFCTAGDDNRVFSTTKNKAMKQWYKIRCYSADNYLTYDYFLCESPEEALSLAKARYPKHKGFYAYKRPCDGTTGEFIGKYACHLRGNAWENGLYTQPLLIIFSANSKSDAVKTAKYYLNENNKKGAYHLTFSVGDKPVYIRVTNGRDPLNKIVKGLGGSNPWE